VLGAYLLHLGDGSHYTGWSTNIAARVAAHVRGDGAHLTRAAVARGVSVQLAVVWPGAGPEVERALKRSPPAKARCPWCSSRPRALAAWSARILYPSAVP
jgi:predicted GIY-YIG superfamily endonuclease